MASLLILNRHCPRAPLLPLAGHAYLSCSQAFLQPKTEQKAICTRSAAQHSREPARVDLDEIVGLDNRATWVVKDLTDHLLRAQCLTGIESHPSPIMAAAPLPLSLPPPPTPPPPGGAGAAGRAARPGAARPLGAGQGGSDSGGAVGLRERRRSLPSSPRRSALRPGRTDSPLTPSHPLRPGRRRRRRRGAARQRKEQVSAAGRPGRGRAVRERGGRVGGAGPARGAGSVGGPLGPPTFSDPGCLCGSFCLCRQRAPSPAL